MADGSCFSKVIPTLQADGHQVIAAQNSLEGDVAAVKRALGRVPSPAILVGHSQGGIIITAAGTDDRVAGLVYDIQSSHVPMLSHPDVVIQAIRAAAAAV